jgi:hypothetical protein
MKKAPAIFSALLAFSIMTACQNGANGDITTTPTDLTGTDNTTTSVTDTVTDTLTAANVNNAGNGTTIAGAADGTASPLEAVAVTVTNAVKFPVLVDVTDPARLTDYFLIDPENPDYNSILVKESMLSSNMTELIIVDAISDDAAKDAEKVLKDRRKKAIDTDAFYPADKTKAESSVVGREGHYAFYILSDNAHEAEKVLKEELKKL